ncbi:hypothetical protein [Piscinibacter sp. XHJ-5]|uniref:hypothetical protein n=1 Tax=Piscinibacter sp. XHJ-5 TaxID=3037797 RepID=UPI002452B0E0|nr:hypothetical protein [Piscinibacter sp. XHJ-5]
MIELVAVAGFVAFCGVLFFLVWAANGGVVAPKTTRDVPGAGTAGDGGSGGRGDSGSSC